MRDLFNDPYGIPSDRAETKCLLVDKLREKVNLWRSRDYPGASDTSRTLLDYWFKREHTVDTPEGQKTFKYYFCQREAIETLIYCYEVEQARRLKMLRKKFGFQKELFAFEDKHDIYPKYCFKMATGSGKTKVMSLAIVWSYFHRLYEQDSPLSQTFALVAPNVIVFERLKLDFAEGKIFDQDPLIPEEWKGDWQLETVLRGDPPERIRPGTLFLTNIQQLYERAGPEESHPVGALLPPKPKKEIQTSGVKYLDALKRLPELMVLDDEAHHVHDEHLKWWEAIEDLNKLVKQGLTMQLDFSATPKDRGGNLFDHIVVDYPLGEAIDDGIVKKIIVGRVKNPKEYDVKNFAKRFRIWIEAAINRWKEYREALKDTGKRPVLFIMAEDTVAANEVYEYLLGYPSFNEDNVLLIHTKERGKDKGEISDKDLDKAREAARKIDDPDNKIDVIVSVLMLREGWDVKSVTVVLGLRAFTAEAKILPEQAVGRGLRLMDFPGSGREEACDIIGNNKFISIIQGVEEEGVKVTTKDLTKGVNIVVIKPEAKRSQFNIRIPNLPPKHSAFGRLPLETLMLEDIPNYTIDFEKAGSLDKIKYEGYDARKMAKYGKRRPEFIREWEISPIRSPVDVVNFFTGQIIKQARLTREAFSHIAPLVIDYIEKVLFEKEVSHEDEKVVSRLNHEDAQSAILTAFADAIRALERPKEEVKFKGSFIELKDTKPFDWDRDKAIKLKKTIFNLVPFDNSLERDFALFLDKAEDIKSFAKLVHWKTLFKLEYLSEGGGLRHYYPDFVIEDKNGNSYVIETKGYAYEEATLKDARAREWCLDVARETGQKWEYYRIPQQIFDSSRAMTLIKLIEEVKKKPVDKQPFLFDWVDESRKYVDFLPLYSLQAAAGKFGEGQVVEEKGWIRADIGRKLDPNMFVARIVGHSMEPRIEDGDLCVFRANVTGTRQGKIVLAQSRHINDPETGGSYTVKIYSSKKKTEKDGTWRHTEIALKPLNPTYTPIVLRNVVEGDFKIIAEFIGKTKR